MPISVNTGDIMTTINVIEKKLIKSPEREFSGLNNDKPLHILASIEVSIIIQIDDVQDINGVELHWGLYDIEINALVEDNSDISYKTPKKVIDEIDIYEYRQAINKKELINKDKKYNMEIRAIISGLEPEVIDTEEVQMIGF